MKVYRFEGSVTVTATLEVKAKSRAEAIRKSLALPVTLAPHGLEHEGIEEGESWTVEAADGEVQDIRLVLE